MKLRHERTNVYFDIAFNFIPPFSPLGRALRTTVTLILRVLDAGVTSTLLLRERERTFGRWQARRRNTVLLFVP